MALCGRRRALDEPRLEAGVVVPPEGYLAAARATCDAHGALLWMDEIQSGTGRTGIWFEHQRAGVRPETADPGAGPPKCQ